MSFRPFSDTDRSIVKNMMLNKSVKDISLLLDRDKDEVLGLIRELVGDSGIVTHQMKLDSKVRKPAPVKINTKKDDEKRAKDVEKAQKRLRRDRENERKVKKNRAGEIIYKTRVIDYSEMISVRIDSKTIIQVPKAADIELEKQKFISNQKNYKHLTPMERGKLN